MSPMSFAGSAAFRYYGSDPIFIMTSATIANPQELAERLTEKKVQLIDDNGAPTGRKHFIVYQPPIVNAQLGIRRSATLETKQLASAHQKEISRQFFLPGPCPGRSVVDVFAKSHSPRTRSEID